PEAEEDAAAHGSAGEARRQGGKRGRKLCYGLELSRGAHVPSIVLSFYLGLVPRASLAVRSCAGGDCSSRRAPMATMSRALGSAFVGFTRTPAVPATTPLPLPSSRA
uniref:Uncharacterized protein n=1 Tax=Aegilops tauschii subsp. strangulata TaxID=200361 RepID=A0A453LYS4_AEGTS